MKRTKYLLLRFAVMTLAALLFVISCAAFSACEQEKESEIPITGIKLDKISLTLMIGEEARLTAKINPVDATDKRVVWKTSNEAVITVEDGKLEAAGEGVAIVIAATADDKYSAYCTVDVKGIRFPESEIVLTEGVGYSEFRPTCAHSYELISSNPKVVSFDSADLGDLTIFAKSPGTAIVIAISKEGYVDTCTVTVVPYEPEEQFEWDAGWLNGEFLKVDEAYELGLIDYSDVLSLAFYYDVGFFYFSNEDTIPDNYIPKPLYPIELDESIHDKILGICKEQSGEENATIRYCGRYGDCIAIRVFLGYEIFDYPVDYIEIDELYIMEMPFYYPIIWHKL